MANEFLSIFSLVGLRTIHVSGGVPGSIIIQILLTNVRKIDSIHIKSLIRFPSVSVFESVSCPDLDTHFLRRHRFASSVFFVRISECHE